MAYIDGHKEEFGVEPICQVLQFAPSTYYAAESRTPSPRAVSDGLLGEHIKRVHEDNYAVYGVRKVWRQLRREGETAGRDQVGRVMHDLGLQGVRRGKAKRTTVSGDVASRPGDLVDRHFFAAAPNRLWLADITYVWTWSGFCYTSFITDAFARRIVGWRVSRSLRTDLALDALEMAIFSRRDDDLSHLVHHSDRGGSIFGHPLHRAAGRRTGGRLGWLQGRQLRQCPRRDGQRALQDRTDPSPRTVEDDGATRAGHSGLGPMVERASTARGLWLRPAGRARGELLPSLG